MTDKTIHDPDTDLCERTAEVAAEWWTSRLMQGNKRDFKMYLKRNVAKFLSEQGEVFLENDYDPKGILLEAVRFAGIECEGFMHSGDGILPRKHYTAVQPGRITPKEGYGNWTSKILI